MSRFEFYVTAFNIKKFFDFFCKICILVIDIFSVNLYIIKHHAAVAQLVEQRTENPCVVSSILTGGSKTCLFSDRFFLWAREPVKICSEAKYFHKKPPAMRVRDKNL